MNGQVTSDLQLFMFKNWRHLACMLWGVYLTHDLLHGQKGGELLALHVQAREKLDDQPVRGIT